MEPLSKKEYSFLFIATLTVLGFYVAISYFLSFWLILVLFFAHICVVIFLASFTQKTWLSLFFPLLWLILDFVIDIFVPLSLFIGLPMAFLFFAVRRDFALRIKIDYQKSVRSALSQTFILSALILAIFVAFNTTYDDIKKLALDGTDLLTNIEFGGEKGLTDMTFDELVDTKTEPLLTECQGNKNCEKSILTEAKNKIFAEFGIDQNENIGKESVLKYQIEKQFEEFVDFPLSAFFGFVIFAVLAPFSLLFSVVISALSSVLFIILRLTFILRVRKIPVEQEVLV